MRGRFAASTFSIGSLVINDGQTCGATMAKFIQKLLKHEDGPTAVEYAVMLALIVGVCIASVNVLANAAGDSFNDSGSQLSGILGS